MAKVITYTNSATDFTVKPTRTPLTNATDKSITLNYAKTSDVVGAGKTATIEKTIVSISYGAQTYYSSPGPSYTIPAGSSATVNTARGSKLTLTVA